MAKCGLCEKTLEEGRVDLHNLDHGYEFPYKIRWEENGSFTASNRVVRNLCSECMRKIMKTVNECINSRTEV